jgi:RHS repeat-associated protein
LQTSPAEVTLADYQTVSAQTSFFRPNGSYTFAAQRCYAVSGPPTCYTDATRNTTVAMPAPSTPVVTAPAVDHDGAYTVSWSSTAPAGGSYDAHYGYQYHWRERINGGSWSGWTAAGTATSKPFTKNSSIYEYQTKTCGGGGCSTDSAIKKVVVAKKPANPDVTVSASPTSIQVSWTPGSGYPAGAEKRYDLQESVDGGPYGNAPAYDNIAMSWSRTPAANTRYQYQVRAWYVLSGQTSTATDSVLSDEIYLPGTPAINDVTQLDRETSTDVTITWTAPGSGGPVSAYNLQRCNVSTSDCTNNGNWSPIYQDTVVSHLDTGDKTRGHTYSYRVQATNSSGAGSWSAPVTVRIQYATPAVPLLSNNVDGFASYNGIYTLSWAANGGVVSGFEVEESELPDTWPGTRLMLQPGQLSMQFDKPSNYDDHPKPYYYRVRAVNDDTEEGWIEWAELSVSVNNYPRPAGIPLALLNPAESDGRYTLSWAPSTDPATVTHYRLDRLDTGDIDYPKVPYITGHSPYLKEISGGVSGEWYAWAIQACFLPPEEHAEEACSSYTSTLDVYIPYEVPATPANLSSATNNADGRFILTWSPSVSGVLAYYELEETVNGAVGIVNAGTSTSFERENVSGHYEFRVRACSPDADGPNLTPDQACSDWSASIAFTVAIIPAPPAPTLAGANQFNVDTNAIDQTLMTNGAFDVTSSGAASYRVPINVARGTAGQEPNIALLYNSQSDNGLLGMGWLLQAGGEISRCRQTLSVDRQSVPMNWSETDRFCLDGKRLLLVEGSAYGGVGAKYRTEVDSYVVVTSVGGSLGHPDYFTVEAKDGSRYQYGATGNDASKQIALDSNGNAIANRTLSWKLKRQQDRVGNAIAYQYERTPQHHHLTKIYYAYGSSDASINESAYNAWVEFEYETRGDTLLRYTGGYEFSEDQRLEQITAYANSGTTIFRQYQLDYSDGVDDDNLSRLESIEECVSASNCLAPLSFAWGAAGSGNITQSVATMTLGNWANYNYNASTTTVKVPNYVYTLADIDGDGRQDMVRYLSGEGLRHYEQSPSGSFVQQLFQSGSALAPFSLDMGPNGARKPLNVQIQPIDINADGRMDIALFVGTTHDSGTGQWHLFLSVPVSASGSNWQLQQRTDFVFPTTTRNIRFADMNGDGLSDMVEMLDPLSISGQLYRNIYYLERDSSKPVSSNLQYRFGSPVAISDQSGFSSIDNPQSATFQKGQHLAFGDIDRDGRMDIVALSHRSENPGQAAGGSYYILDCEWTDELAVAYQTGSRSQPALTRGAVLWHKFDDVPPHPPQAGETCRSLRPEASETAGDVNVVDINGDGVMDIVYTRKVGMPSGAREFSFIYYALGTGNGSFAPAQLVLSGRSEFPTSSSTNTSGWEYGDNTTNLQVVDYDGDGDMDIAWAVKTTGQVYLTKWTGNGYEPGYSVIFSESSPSARNLLNDVNGDGQYDRFREANGVFNFYRGADRSPKNRIDTITNGLGKAISIEYERLNQSDHYTRLGYNSSQTTQPYTLNFGGTVVNTGMSWTQIVNVLSQEELYTSINDPFGDLDAAAVSLETNLKNTLSSALYRETVTPVLEMAGPLLLVTSVRETQPIAGASPEDSVQLSESSQHYYYHQSKIQAAGRGYLGFKQFTMVDSQTLIRSETTYRQDWPFNGMPVSEKRYSKDGNLLSETQFTQQLEGQGSHRTFANAWKTEAKQSGSGALGALMVFNAEVETREYELVDNGETQGPLLKRSVQRIDQRDDAGNVEESVTESYDGQDSLFQRVSTSYDISTNTQEKFWGLVKQSTAVTQRPSALNPSRTRVTEYSYYDSDGPCSSGELGYANNTLRGLPCTQRLLPDAGDPTAQALTTRYYYDHFGHPVFTQQSNDAGNEQRLSAYTRYDSAGRYAEEVFGVFNAALSGAGSGFGPYDTLASQAGMTVQRVSHVLERDHFGTPTRTQRHVGGSQTVQHTAATTPFGQVYFEADSSGGYRVLTASPGAGSHCPASTAWRTQVLSAGGGEAGGCYDLLGRETRTLQRGFDGRWSMRDTKYDDQGRARYMSEPTLQFESRYWTTNDYDLYDRVIHSQHPFNQVDDTSGADLSTPAHTTFDYDGLTVTTTNPKGQHKTETKNVNGELVSTQDHDSHTTTFVYDVYGQLTQMTDPGWNSTVITYDSFGRKISMSDPDKGDWVYRYNGVGDLICQQDANGQIITNRYDAAGRLLERFDYASGGDCSNPSGALTGHAVFTYDTAANGLGQLVSETDTVTQFTRGTRFDSFGRPVLSETVIPGAGSHFQKTTYDQYSRVFQSFDAGRVGEDFSHNGVRHGYNATGYLNQLLDAQMINGEPAQRYYAVQAMDARGHVTQAVYGDNAIDVTAAYHAQSGRLETLQAYNAQGHTVHDLDLRWDHVGNVVYRHDVSWNGASQSAKNIKETFAYDHLNRLTSYTLSGDASGATTVNYDSLGLGNIQSKSDVVDNATYQYGQNAGPHAVTTIGSRQLYYDANGNLIRETDNDAQVRALSYTVYDMVNRIDHPAGSTTFQYDTQRQRYQRIDTRNGQTTTTLYIGATEKIYYPDDTIEWKRNIGGIALITHKLNASESQITGTQTRFLLKDHLGSINVITDEHGNPTETLAFDPWGKRRNTDSWSALTDVSPYYKDNKPTTSRGFTSHEMIDGANIVHMNGRIYDNHIARFIQADPIIQDPTMLGSLNRYSYVWNNPLNATDPSGFEGYHSSGDVRTTDKIHETRAKRAGRNESHGGSTKTISCDKGCEYGGGSGFGIDVRGGKAAGDAQAKSGGTAQAATNSDVKPENGVVAEEIGSDGKTVTFNIEVFQNNTPPGPEADDPSRTIRGSGQSELDDNGVKRVSSNKIAENEKDEMDNLSETQGYKKVSTFIANDTGNAKREQYWAEYYKTEETAERRAYKALIVEGVQQGKTKLGTPDGVEVKRGEIGGKLITTMHGHPRGNSASPTDYINSAASNNAPGVILKLNGEKRGGNHEYREQRYRGVCADSIGKCTGKVINYP